MANDTVPMDSYMLLLKQRDDLLNVANMVDHVIQQWRESGREPAYGQWQNLQDVAKQAIKDATDQ